MHARYGSAPRRGKDKSFLKYNSNGTVNAPFFLALMQEKTDAETMCFGASTAMQANEEGSPLATALVAPFYARLSAVKIFRQGKF
jgi:hypothetical protein